MGKFKLVLITIIIFLIQIISVVFINENHGDSEASWIILVITILLYFIKHNNIKKSFQLNNKTFYVTIIVSWTILNIISFFVLTSFLESGILNGYGDLFPGLEYVIIPFFFEFQLGVILALELIWIIIKKVFKIEINRNQEQKTKLLKKLSIIIGILILTVILGYFAIIGTETLIYNNKLNKIKKEAEIEFKYSTDTMVYIDLDNYKMNVIRDGRGPIIHNVSESTFEEIQTNYFTVHYAGMREVYNKNGIICYIIKHYSISNDDTIFISVNNNKYYIVYNNGECLF